MTDTDKPHPSKLLPLSVEAGTTPTEATRRVIAEYRKAGGYDWSPIYEGDTWAVLENGVTYMIRPKVTGEDGVASPYGVEMAVSTSFESPPGPTSAEAYEAWVGPRRAQFEAAGLRAQPMATAMTRALRKLTEEVRPFTPAEAEAIAQRIADMARPVPIRRRAVRWVRARLCR